MTQVSGILETVLYVTDPTASAEFYRRLFGFRTLIESERLIALDVAGRSVLLLFLRGATGEPFPTFGGVIPPHDGSGRNHLAFSITADDIQPWLDRLESLAIPVESTVTWPGNARSIYFRDPDDHLVELLTPGFWATY